jgi:predicted dinucleotide-binding enzyme
MVGRAIASRLVALGHEVTMGSRSAGGEKARAWALNAGEKAAEGSFADAAAGADVLFNCTNGGGSIEALHAAGKERIAGKILIDVANPLDFSKGMPPSLFVTNTDSLGERIQREFPDVKVVKTLNTVNCELMVDPARVAGAEHHMFLCGNDLEAKTRVSELLRSFGWKHLLDLGGIEAARATEAYLHLWLKLWGSLQTLEFNVKIVT